MALGSPLTLNSADSLFYANLNKPDIQKFVRDYTGGYNVLNFLAEKGGSRKADAEYGEVQDGLMTEGVAQQIISSVSVISSTVLQINFLDNTYPYFRNMDNVTNNGALNTRARVISPSGAPGYIIIEALDDAQTLSSGDWAANTYVTAEWNTHPYKSVGMTPLDEVPTLVFNYCEKLRETVYVDRDEAIQTWVEGDKGYWYTTKEMTTFDRMMRFSEIRSLKGTRGLLSQDKTSSNGGLEWAIKDNLRGGIWTPFFSNPTVDIWTEWVFEMANRQKSPTSFITVLTGRGALNNFQTFTENFIQYAGLYNTFGGAAVEGIDVMRYAAGAMTVQFVHLPSLNDTNYFTNPSQVAGLTGSVEYNSMYGVDVNMMKTIASNAKLPFMERIYRGKQEMVYKIMPGVVDEDFLEKGTGAIAVTDADNMSIQFLTYSGVNAFPYYGGYFAPGM